MGNLPQPDVSAYDGSLIVKTTTFNKANKSENNGVDRVRKAVKMLDKEISKRLTIDRLDPTGDVSIEDQLIINKTVVFELRKITLMLETFIKNN